MLPSVIVYGAVTLVAALCAALMGLPSLFAAPLEGRAAISLAAGTLLAAVVVLGGRALEKRAWYAKMADLLREPVKALLGPRAGAPEAAIVALASAMGEEAGFRGLIQPGLVLLFVRHLAMEPRPAILLAILTTAFSFMLLHPPWKRELRPWTFFALLMGILWGAIAAWSGSLAAPMLSHFLVNFFNLRRLLAWQPSV